MTQPDDPTPDAPPSAAARAATEPELGAQATSEVAVCEPALAIAGQGNESAAVSESELSESELERDLAALLFVSTEPLSKGRLASLVGGASEKRIAEALARLQQRLATACLPWELREIAGGWQLFTTPDVAETVALLGKAKKDEKLSGAGLETLAIVAYRQPVTKGEIEAIRGVQVGPILRTLVDRGLVKVGGRSDDPGHPLLYITTRKFLDAFALASLDDLPRDGELLRD